MYPLFSLATFLLLPASSFGLPSAYYNDPKDIQSVISRVTRLRIRKLEIKSYDARKYLERDYEQRHSSYTNNYGGACKYDKYTAIMVTQYGRGN